MKLNFPVGVETFAEIIEDKYIYVDKTELIYQLIQANKYIFLSRPRRFGKSLLLSTIEAYFSGLRELFDGLWLGQAQGVDWTPYPVLRLNFVSSKNDNEDLTELIDRHLSKWESQLNITDHRKSLGQRFFNIIEHTYETTGSRVVVLIDEYDKALTGTMDNLDQHEQVKDILKPVFSVLKDADRYIRFAMLTGVTRFARLSIFSDLNNIEDISLNKSYATLCGITEPEVRQYMSAGVEDFAAELGCDFESMMQTLKDNYDGYHFARESADVYNPYSLLLALKNKELSHRWFETGTPSFLVKMMQQSDMDVQSILSTEADATSLSSSEVASGNITALLFQTGYLTIKDYNQEDREYILGIPNREVSEGLFKCLLPEYSGQGKDSSLMAVRRMRSAVRAGQPDEMMECLKAFIAGVPYTLSNGRAESYFQNNLYIIFTLLGFSVEAEYTTSRGRIDILLKTPKYIYVMELKLNGSAQDALRQINENGYCEQFALDDRQLFRIGINFNRKKRNIDQWIIEGGVAEP